VDVCGALTDSPYAGAYWRKLKQRLKDEGSEVVTFCHGLKLEASDGKKYATDCTNTKSMFRIIQSIPSPKAEPFKIDGGILDLGLQSDIEDFEDSIQFYAAKKEGVDVLITRKKKDYPKHSMSIMTPSEFIKSQVQ
jgi:hypothetical protein